MAKDLKRSVTIRGHRTSLSLEPEFWAELQSAAKAQALSTAVLIDLIDNQRGSRNLSSAIRIYLLNRLLSK